MNTNEKNILYGLAFDCPYQTRKDGCPFIESDLFSFKERVSWINSLSTNRRKEIAEYHAECSKNRFYRE
jgi:hypothetical protein